jgi:hypothetical protein
LCSLPYQSYALDRSFEADVVFQWTSREVVEGAAPVYCETSGRKVVHNDI